MNTRAVRSASRAATPESASVAQPVLDIVARIAECAPELRDAERKVAEFILADLARAAHASIGTLARDTGVSVATVTRFAKAVGCRDVRELKLLVAQAAAVGRRFLVPAEQVPAEEDANPATVVYDEIRVALAHNHQLLRNASFDAAADRLVGAKMIYVYGQGGGSTALADELRFRLVRFGRPVATYQDSLLQRMVSATLSRDAVVVALSVSGRVPELLENCRLAKRYGATLIAITAPASPLAKLADHLIPVVAFETDFIYKPSTSRYAMMMAIDVLVTGVALRLGDAGRESLRRIKHALDAHRGGGDRQPVGD
ncbi:MurR/RpiR family transcriptional regulator [Burkholderia multivorans]|uniref:Transcriptional regulator, RpiR family n=1 Tax=Burkholderia multivorans CGD2 TaxID=513052 RepID=B9BTW2_9BURK|nr:MurR/RpiR family transcriptional regulator [Burkholderia multivorans]EEE05880.1 transcriptional regulator, RpiR family [Burkholderia multivorans CGD2]EEE12700.1 transcriptional regulator, RpiR family [Burkholderia multivorans CGD2M]EKS9913065.1 MurR/RpiR family transcriptional regulator [Burkholderia multivorans]KVS16610.1 transcriptional regulator [Burkholderia multivorans]MBU9183769.1 MurR/RpiR family transcriptional regulator [Burkholderia multivorans]